MKIERELLDRRERLQDEVEFMEKYLAEALPGTLLIREGQRRELIYDHFEKGKHKSTYIGIANMELAEQLATKQYYKKLLPCLKNEIKAIDDFLKKYRPQEKYDAFEKIGKRRDYTKPIFVSPGLKVSKWLSEQYEPNPNYKDELKVVSDTGECFRSKSEMIIAEIISRYEDLEYRYEKPLLLPGAAHPIYPDFTIINKRTGRVYYLEHVGMIDNPEYAIAFASKMNFYAKNNIRLGEQLLCTYETSRYGLDVQAVKKVIEQMLESV